MGIWFLCIVGALTHYFIHPEEYTAAKIATFLDHYESWTLLLFLVLSVARAFVLLPVTPLIFAGALLLPGSPWTVLGMSLLGIGLASTLIYYFSDWLGFRPHFEKAAPKQLGKITHWLKHPMGPLFVAGWAVFPFVPTDLVCYVAGTVRMSFWKFIGAVLLGEAILCAIYIFGSNWVSRSMI